MNIMKEALDAIVPRSCMICGRVSDLRIGEALVCKRCLADLVPVDKERRWQFCLSEPFHGDPYPKLTLYVPFGYKDSVVRIVRDLKFEGKEELGSLMGVLLSKCLRSDGVSFDVCVPVPLSKKRLSERGYNQAQLIASKIASEYKVPLLPEALIRTRNTGRQTDLTDTGERAANVRGAFEQGDVSDIKGRVVLLVDDVATTGNTLREAAVTLLDGGAHNVLCCAFAGNRALKNLESY